MKTLSPDQLYYFHDQLTFVMVFFWISLSYIGYKLKNEEYKRFISYGLILFAVLLEILDYSNRFFLDSAYVVSLQSDLPLHFCQFGFYFSLAGIYIAVNNKKISDYR